MKYVFAILLLAGTMQAQTRAQLKADNQLLWDTAMSLSQELDKVKAELAEQKENTDKLAKFALDQFIELESVKAQNKLLLTNLTNLANAPAKTVVVPVFESAPVPEPQTIRVIHDAAPYQEPWTSPVTCSGYDIPTPGLTLTYSNCR